MTLFAGTVFGSANGSPGTPMQGHLDSIDPLTSVFGKLKSIAVDSQGKIYLLEGENHNSMRTITSGLGLFVKIFTYCLSYSNYVACCYRVVGTYFEYNIDSGSYTDGPLSNVTDVEFGSYVIKMTVDFSNDEGNILFADPAFNVIRYLDMGGKKNIVPRLFVFCTSVIILNVYVILHLHSFRIQNVRGNRCIWTSQ